MPIALAALKQALETDARYDAAVTSGKNRELLALLNAEEAGQTVFSIVPSEDVLEAIGDGIRNLTPDQRDTLRLILTPGQVDFNKDALRTELREIFNGVTAVLTRLSAVATRTRTYGEAFGDAVTLRDLWAALRQIPKSYLAQYLAR